MGSRNGLKVRIGAAVLVGSLATLAAPVAMAGAEVTPGPPINVTASAGLEKATVSWSAPTDGTATVITGYTASSTPGGVSCTVTGATGSAPTTCNIVGLTAGTPYTFQVISLTQTGQSVASSPSAPITPTGAPTTTAVTTTTAKTTTTVAKTTTTKATTSSSNSSMWIWIVIAAVVLALIAGGIAMYVASTRRKEADGAWIPKARAGLETATLARGLLMVQPQGGDSQLPEVRAQAEDAARTLDRAAAQAPDEARRQAASSVAEGLRGVVFSLEAEHLLRTNPTAPTSEALAEADLSRRRRSAELDAALAQLDVATRPPAN